MKLTQQEQVITGLLIGAVAGYLLNRSIIVPYVRLPPDPRRFYGDPEVEIEISGKRWHARLDSGNGSGSFMMKKDTADYFEIRRKFHPVKHVSHVCE